VLINLVLNFSNQIFVQLLLCFLHLGEQSHNVPFSSVCRRVGTSCFVNDFLCNSRVFVHKLAAHCFELGSLLFQLGFYVLQAHPALLQQLSEVQSSIHVGLLQVVKRFVGRLEPDQAEPVGLVINCRKHYAALL